MSGMMLHGLGDCTPALHCGCLDGVEVQELGGHREGVWSRLLRWLSSWRPTR